MPGMPSMMPQTAQIAFISPEGMIVHWDVGSPGAFDSDPLICPGKYNFPQGAIYRMKLTNIPGRDGVELYPTIEIGRTTARTEAFLSHNAVPIQFTPEDFDQVLTGNFVTKVIYLPDPEFQEIALAGVETLVSTRLDPGVNPISEADRRGAILAIIRLGNKDVELPGGQPTPAQVQQAMYAPGVAPGQQAPIGMPASMGMSTIPNNYISGLTAPQYGTPITGTPIGLAGPQEIPFGSPAGLTKHVMVNHSRVRLPKPMKKIRYDVKQTPAVRYPRQQSRVYIHESIGAGHAAPQPSCPTGDCPN